MFLDLAIAFDLVRRRCDLVYDGTRLVLDATAVTPMLVALGSDRRAEPDDTLPDGSTEGSIAAGSLNPRRGWAGDAFGGGERVGSRLWLLSRSKLTDDTLIAVSDFAEQALQPLADAHGADLSVAASRAAPNAILLDAMLGAERQQLKLRAGA